MSVAYQIVDILLSGVIAGVATFLVSAVAPGYALVIGVVLASMYYFSRNPWGSPEGDRINDYIDETYDRFLPF
ncbi:hypothetical protein ACFQE8_07785 [Salinirubellus sp. GCM10025818]|jgi:hypothetical protein|uniref:hypothetical protein n=1 Tax=Salinirubellus TaxID=2162630 RepID=UPI0030D5C511